MSRPVDPGTPAATDERAAMVSPPRLADAGDLVTDPGVHRARLFRHRLNTGAVSSFKNLPNEWPFQKPG